jgi:hypothetical protein
LIFLKQINQADNASTVTPYQGIEYQHKGEFNSSAKLKLQVLEKKECCATSLYEYSQEYFYYQDTDFLE